MKTLIIVKESEYAWINETLPHVHPLLTPVCNKPLIEYWVDFAILCGSQEIRIVSDGPTRPAEIWMGDGTRFGVKISYSSVQENDPLDKILLKNSGFCGLSQVLVLQGFFFIHYHKQNQYSHLIQTSPEGIISSCDTGSLSKQNTDFKDNGISTGQKPLFAMSPLKSMADLHDLSMNILYNQADHYFLPNYNNEAGHYKGSNIRIAQTAQIIHPVIIGNNVKIHEFAVIGPGAVIGEDAIIDGHSRIHDSIVYARTYVGEHLEFDGKMVSGETLIDPVYGAVMQLEDKRLLSEVADSDYGVFASLLHRIFALSLLIFLAIPYALLSVIIRLQGKWHTEETTSLLNKKGKTLHHRHIQIDTTGFAGRIAKNLNLDRYPLLTLAVSGKLRLIGHHLRRSSAINERKIAELPSYHPGVFSFSEGEPLPLMAGEMELSELYHMDRRTLATDIVMTFRALSKKNCMEGKHEN